jgi:hypothetical protein
VLGTIVFDMLFEIPCHFGYYGYKIKECYYKLDFGRHRSSNEGDYLI